MFKVIDEGNSFYTVKAVPIFEMHTDRGFPCDTKWMSAAITQHNSLREQGYRPPVIIGHNVKGIEKEAVGFLDNLVLKGKRLYADLVRIPKGVKEKIVRNAYPSRSVEVLPQSRRILTLALLGGTTPHFTLPQIAYEQETNETHLWFRSPEMELTEEMKKEFSGLVAEATAKAVPEAIEAYFEDNGEPGSAGAAPADGETVASTYVDPDTGEEYAIPAVLAKVLAAGTHAGKAAAAGGKASAKLGLGKGVGRKVGRQVGKAGGFVKRHPVGAAAAAGAGAAAGRASKKGRYEGYAIDDETGEVYHDGEPLGIIVTYADMKEVGMKVPTAEKKPQKLPTITGVNPDLTISEEDVGEGSGEEDDMTEAIAAITGENVQPLDREESDQFTLLQQQQQENYDLSQRLGRVETANMLLSEGRRAEEYTKWLEEQRTAGTPVGDIEKTAAFMMSLSPDQVEQHKTLLLSQPKVAFEKAENAVNFTRDTGNADKVKQDYAQNKETYQSLGVTDKDLQWADYVRVNKLQGEK